MADFTSRDVTGRSPCNYACAVNAVHDFCMRFLGDNRYKELKRLTDPWDFSNKIGDPKDRPWADGQP
jgi:hypothetical protein